MAAIHSTHLAMSQVLPFDWFKTDHLVSGESTLHWVTLFSARSRIFLPIAQSCAALFCCRLAIRASSLGWLVGNKKVVALCNNRPLQFLIKLVIIID